MNRIKKYSLISVLSLVFGLLLIFGSNTINAESQSKEQDEYFLSFDVYRGNYENLHAVYSNYYMGRPEYDVFDHDAWTLKAFDIEYELHTHTGKSITKKMSYLADEDYTWIDEIAFADIVTPYEEVEVQYYKRDDGDFVEPYLLHFDLYLEESDGKMILKVPKLKVNENYFGNSEDAKAIEINDIQTQLIPDDIYLDGRNGDDNNHGRSLSNPVKSFVKAKELAAIKPNTSKKIIVIGTTEIEGNIDLSGINTEIIRGENFNNYLFAVPSGKTASLTNIVIDGNSENNNKIEKSLISVKNGATLNIGEAAVLRNNYIKYIENKYTNGGAVNAKSATVNMTSGVIEDNQATRGGGIYLEKSTLNFSGGVIQNNQSRRVIDRSIEPAAVYSAGAGIIAKDGSTINMSGDSKVLNNMSDERGGGISLGSENPDKTNTLNMTGGLIEGNIAGSAGGGIFIQARYNPGQASKAYISGGAILDNRMLDYGYGNSEFGGGGIYVNGANAYYGGNAELYITNALIYNNESKLDGAGYAACPISKTKIHVTNGVAIYDNEARKGNEIYILSSVGYGAHSGKPDYKLSDRMLGGNLYRWQNEDNTFLKAEEHEGTLKISGEELILHTGEQANELAKKLGKVIISGNTSNTRGGGIGSNGTVIFGEEKDLTEVAVSKVWKDNDNKDKTRPEAIEVQLLAKLKGSKEEYVIETRKLSKDNNWKTIFENLPKENNGVELEYSVKEKEIAGYESKISGNVKDGFIIENKPTPTTSTTTTEPTATSTTAPTTSSTEPVTSPTTTPKTPPTTGERVEISMGVSLLLLAVAGTMIVIRKRRED